MMMLNGSNILASVLPQLSQTQTGSQVVYTTGYSIAHHALKVVSGVSKVQQVFCCLFTYVRKEFFGEDSEDSLTWAQLLAGSLATVPRSISVVLIGSYMYEKGVKSICELRVWYVRAIISEMKFIIDYSFKQSLKICNLLLIFNAEISWIKID